MISRQTVWLHGSHPKNGTLQVAEYLVRIEGDPHLYKNQTDCRTFHELLEYALLRVLKHALAKNKSFVIRVCHQSVVSHKNLALAATAKCTLIWIPKTEMP